MPQFIQTESSNVTVTQGQVAVLECSITNLGNYTTIWMSPRRVLLTRRDVRYIDDDRISVERPYESDLHLHIRDVDLKDQGSYLCLTNTTPVIMRTVILIVQVPPTVTVNVSTTWVSVGSMAKLDCQASGNPKPTVSWSRISPNGVRKPLGLDGDILVIDDISNSCTGTYVCIADNGVGIPAEGTIQVKLLPEEHRPPAIPGDTSPSPTITMTTNKGNDVNLYMEEDEGNRANLLCHIEGVSWTDNDHLKVVWFDRLSLPLYVNDLKLSDDERYSARSCYGTKGDEEEGEKVRDSGDIDDDNCQEGIDDSLFSKLTIQSVDRHDTGVYGCMIYTGTEEHYVNIHLYVRVPIKITTSNLVTLPGQRGYGIGCYASGIPKPEVAWYSGDNVFIRSGEELPLEENEALVSYTCVASNYLENRTENVYAAVAVPFNVDSEVMTANSSVIWLSWELSSDSSPEALRGYTVLLNNETVQLESDVQRYAFFVKPSTSLERYKFTVFARSVFGTSPGVTHEVIIVPDKDTWNFDAHPGDSVDLKCSINNPEQKEFYWKDKGNSLIFAGGIPVSGSNRWRVDVVNQNTSSLHIYKVQQNDEGTYFCGLTGSPIEWRSLHLNVF